MSNVPRMPIVAFNDWPAADQLAWTDAVRRADIFERPAPLAHLRPEQQAKKQSAYGRWLGFITDHISTMVGGSGLDFITRDNLTAFIDKLKRLFAPYTVAGYVTDLDSVVRAFPNIGDIEFLGNAATNLRRQGRPARDKRPRLRPAIELYQLGFDLMDAARGQRDPLKAATVFHDGLLVALLAARPVRLSNLASILIDRHLSRHGGEYWLTFPANETKTKRHLEFPLPEDLSQMMAQYLAQYRPILAAQSGFWKRSDHNGLWVSSHGSQLKRDQVYRRIVARTRQRFGQSINPHLFRDAVATSVAIEDPGHIGIVTTILGHSTTKTAETYYNQASSLEAARNHQAVVRSLRSQRVRET